MPQGERGQIVLFEDFTGPEWIIAETAASGKIGPFRVVGQGVGDADSGLVVNEADPNLNGVGRLTSPNASDDDCIALVTATMFDVGLMGTIVAECRVQFVDLDTKEFFFGFSDQNGDTVNMEGVVIHGATETITLSASNLVGFLLSSELTDDEDWHTVYNGGSTTGVTVSTNLDIDDDAVAGEYQILRLELSIDGTVRWYVDEVLVRTVVGAVSTTADLALNLMLEIKGTSTNETVDIDYLLVTAARDWTI